MTARPDLRLLLPAVVSWACGAATLGAGVGWRLGGAAAAVGVAVAVMVRRRRLPRGGAHAVHRAGAGLTAVALTLVGCALVLAASGLQAWRHDAGSLRALAEQGAAVRVRATVVSDVRVVDGGRGTASVLLRLAVHSVDGRGARSLADGSVLVFAPTSWRQVRRGERVSASGRLGPAGAGDDVVATFAARGPPLTREPAPAVDRIAERLRAGLRDAVDGQPADPRGLLPGLVVGDTSLQPPDLGDAMRATGLTHLAAVSGTNVSIVCALALATARTAGLGRRTRQIAAAAVLAGFVLLARPEPSVLRAAVMGALGLLATGAARRRAALPALSAAVVGLLVWDPWLARSYGFALSVLATLGLLLLAQPWTDALSRRLPRPVAAALAVPLAAQAFCGPVLVLLAGRISLVAVPANVLAEPCVAPATVLGLLAALVSPLSGQVATVIAWLGGLPCRLLATVARTLAAVPHAQVSWPGGAAGAVWLAALTVGAVVGGPRALRTCRRRPSALVGAVCVALAAWVPVPGTASWPPPGWLLVVCDVGQGDAMVLSTGPGRGILIDSGPEPTAVDRCLRQLGVRTLDLVVLTHFHADHVGGLAGALHGRRVGGALVTLVDDPPAEARTARRALADAGVPVRTAAVGEVLRDGPVVAQVLWPERVVHDGSIPNNASIVLRVDVAGLRLLLLGDVETAAARLVAHRLAALPGGPRVDVMKVAHHGSAKQDLGLLSMARPRLALVSVGAHNDYGHPASSTLRALTGLGARVARTDRQGDLAVVVRADGPALVTSGPHPQPVGARR